MQVDDAFSFAISRISLADGWMARGAFSLDADNAAERKCFSQPLLVRESCSDLCQTEGIRAEHGEKESGATTLILSQTHGQMHHCVVKRYSSSPWVDLSYSQHGII